MPFQSEEKAARVGASSFQPAAQPSPDYLDIDVQHLDEEVSRLDAVESAVGDEAARLRSNQRDRQSRKAWAQEDIATSYIQRAYRGRLGRRRAKATKMHLDIKRGWTLVQDKENGEQWYFNTLTGLSQWHAPELFLEPETPAVPQRREEHCSSTRGSYNDTSVMKGSNDGSCPGSASSLPPLSARGSSISSSRASSFSGPSLPFHMRSADNDPRMSSKSLPPLGSMNGSGMDDELESIISESVDEDVQDNEGAEDSGTPRLFLADGSQNPVLRSTIRNALQVSKYDSVSSLLAAGPALQGSGAFHSKERPKMVSLLAGPELAKSKKTKGTTRRPSGIQPPPAVREVADPGLELTKTDVVREAASADATTLMVPSANGKPAKKITKEVCFACWSASRNSKCSLHAKYDGHLVKAEDSVLMCANWEVDAMRRKYRSEEIQEIFMKQSKSLTYNKNRKFFQTVVEFKHPLYRALDEQMTRENKRLWRRAHIKRWLASFIDTLRVGKVPGTEKSTTPGMLRLKNTLFNYKHVQRYSDAVRESQPRPPITLRVETREVQYCVCVDPDPPHGMLIHGGGEGRAYAPRFTKPGSLYQPRVYDLPAPRSIPMPEPSYAEEPPLPVPNRFVDEMENWSWFERMCAHNAIGACQAALTQIEACTPPTGSSALRRTKYPPPITVRFANFARKANPPHNMAVGGLCAELTMTQLVTTYVPPQFGGFTVTDRRSFAPTANRELIFKSLECPATMARYVKRALEHVLNVRKAPTITCSSSVKTQVLEVHSQRTIDEDGCIDREGQMVYGDDAMEILVTNFYGDNRPEQTGEDRLLGFRTGMACAGLPTESESEALAFVPTVDIATPNLPSTNRSETTHADRHYPFCVPSCRDNTTLDFFHLLLDGKSSRNQPQVFTTLGWQDPGLFAMKCDLDAPMGPLHSIVYRSWAFHQEFPVEEFLTDDGVPYWYDRKTGETFWERPLLESETCREEDGGVDGTIVGGESEQATFGVGVEEAPYSQQDMRKYMVKTLEDEKEHTQRIQALLTLDHENPRVLPDKIEEKRKDLDSVDGPTKRRNSVIGEDLGKAKGGNVLDVEKSLATAGAAANLVRGMGGGASKPGVAGGGSPTKGGPQRRGGGGNKAAGGAELTPQSEELVNSMTAALEQILPSLTGKGISGQELLQLGLGLGMGVASQVKGMVSPQKTAGVLVEGMNTGRS
jgi:hypothetical protein